MGHAIAFDRTANFLSIPAQVAQQSRSRSRGHNGERTRIRFGGIEENEAGQMTQLRGNLNRRKVE
jgi:hypothetical protein